MYADERFVLLSDKGITTKYRKNRFHLLYKTDCLLLWILTAISVQRQLLTSHHNGALNTGMLAMST